MRAENMIDEMSDGCYKGHSVFPLSTACAYFYLTLFVHHYLSYVKSI